MITDNRGGYWSLCDGGETWKYVREGPKGGTRVCAEFDCRELQHPDEETPKKHGKHYYDMCLVADGRRFSVHRFTRQELLRGLGARMA